MAQSFAIKRSKTIFNPQEKTWSGLKARCIYDRKTSVGEVLINSLSKAPFNVGQVSCEDGFELMNHEILRNSVRMSLHLRDLGLKEGDVIGVTAGNTRYISQLIVAALTNGYPISTIDPYQDLVHVFSLTEPKLIFCDQSHLEIVKKCVVQLNNTPRIYICDNWNETIHDNQVHNLITLLAPHPEENDFV